MLPSFSALPKKQTPSGSYRSALPKTEPLPDKNTWSIWWILSGFEGDRHLCIPGIKNFEEPLWKHGWTGYLWNDRYRNEKVLLIPAKFYHSKEDQLSGIAIAATIEASVHLLIEVQALVTQSVYGTPQRTVSGLTSAVCNCSWLCWKRGGFHFGVKDVFLNIAGGIKAGKTRQLTSPLCALLSSYEDVVLPVIFALLER